MLSDCVECGEQVSTEAFACPHCGQGSPANGSRRPLIPPGTRILRSDPRAAAKWEEIRLKLRTGEAEQRQNRMLLLAVAREEERQAEMLELIRDRAWRVFSSAGCPRCRAHSVTLMDASRRVRLLRRGRLIAALRKRFCLGCGHAW